MEILCFFSGIAFFYLKNPYPIYFTTALFFLRPNLKFFIYFIFAIIWSYFHQLLIADYGLSNANLLKNASLEGYVYSIPSKSVNKTQFQFLANSINNKLVKINILLSCYDNCPEIHAGEYWHLRANLKKPINLANPGGFDYEGWLSSRHLNWVGTAKKNSFQRLKIKDKFLPLIKFRESLALNLKKIIKNEEILGIVEALTIGLTNHIDKKSWDLFRRTGTTHLIDISGEHIALIAGIAYWLIKFICKNLKNLCLRYPAPKIASIGAILIATIYALVAGFAVPTQRSLITCCLIFSRAFLSQILSHWQAWRYALLAVLLFEPHSVFMLGFYFSFIAVAILILINQRVKTKGIKKMLSMQLACLFGIMPLSLYWFSYASINGLAANLIAIPLVSFIIVPLALIITFLSPWVIIPGSVYILKWLILALMSCLRLIDSFTILNINYTFIAAMSPLGLMATLAILTLLPLSRLYPATLILLVASIFPKYEKIIYGDAKINILDVSQGLAIIVRTAKHTLIYDTGMKFYQGSDMGNLVIIPFLKTLNIKNIDMIVISHPDLDHRGGLLSIESNYKVKELVVDDPNFYHRGRSCHNYPDWSWDDVSFKFFPITKKLHGKNNNSCILQIANKDHKILFSGDIEKLAEKYLASNYKEELKSTVMLIPHHGSKSSSSSAFINQVSPSIAIASYGFDNRYNFPHEEAIKTYNLRNIPIFNTLVCGMISINLKPKELNLNCFRTKKNHDLNDVE